MYTADALELSMITRSVCYRRPSRHVVRSAICRAGHAQREIAAVGPFGSAEGYHLSTSGRAGTTTTGSAAWVSLTRWSPGLSVLGTARRVSRNPVEEHAADVASRRDPVERGVPVTRL